MPPEKYIEFEHLSYDITLFNFQFKIQALLCWAFGFSSFVMTLIPESSTTTGDGLPPEDLEPGPSLGEILGLVALIITILYIFGISWKVMKIFKGEYVPTEPVYLKYK